MSRIYTVSFTGVAVTAQQDLIGIVMAAGKVGKLLAVYLSQSTEVGDTQEEGLSILIKTGATTVGSGGSAPTPIPINVTDAVAGFTARANDTTIASAGTIVTNHADNWNIRMPFQLILPEKMQIELTGGRRLVVGLATTPADSITMSGTIYVEEFG